jgi:integrase
VKKILGRGARETAGKVLNHCDCVFRFAKAHGLCAENPARDVDEILPASVQPTHHPAILNFDGLREILRLADMAPLSPAVRLAARLGAFTYSRPGNVASAEWSEFDLEAEPARWVIPRSKMKVKDRPFDHVVILGPTIAQELRVWRSRSGGGRFVFPSPTGKRPHITVEALDRAYSRTLGLSGKHSPHGWRAAFKTLAVEEGGFSREATELALDHVHDTAVVRAYDRGERLEERRRLSAWWDGLLAPRTSDYPRLRLEGAA